MKTIAVIGGDRKKTFEQVAQKHRVKILFHNGHTGGGQVERQLRPYVRKADAVVVMKSGVCHASMWAAKELAREFKIPITYHVGSASGALLKAVSL